MKEIVFPALIGLALIQAPVAAADVGGAQKAAICQARSTCTIGKTYEAGKSASGDALTVVEIHLGLTDKPDDAPDSGCQSDGKPDGGVEYWLLQGTTAPKRILKLCNDGYGAAGVGEDDSHRRRQPVGSQASRWVCLAMGQHRHVLVVAVAGPSRARL